MSAVKVQRLLVAAAPSLAVTLFGLMGSRRARGIYGRLTKPKWAPPAAVFGPVWSVLYGLIGLTGWRMWSVRAPARTWTLHGVQLVMNAAWSFLFFGVRDKRASLVLVSALDVVIAAQLADLVRQDRAAAAALAPCLGWSMFATTLNASVSDPGAVSEPLVIRAKH